MANEVVMPIIAMFEGHGNCLNVSIILHHARVLRPRFIISEPHCTVAGRSSRTRAYRARTRELREPMPRQIGRVPIQVRLADSKFKIQKQVTVTDVR